jgi:enamine deaminase RidA (YjgF/YER057c/UK114 family)
MRATPITTADDRHPAVAISMGFRVGDLLIISGQVATDAGGAIVGDDLETQAHQVFAKLSRALAAGGSDLAHVVKVTIFVTEMAGNFDTIVALRRRYFSEPYPADTLVEVSSLARPGLLIEIEAIATVP